MQRSNLRNGLNDSRIIVALDGLTDTETADTISRLSPYAAGFKVHDQLDAVNQALANSTVSGIRFLDWKIHDIPKSVEYRLRRLEGKVDIVTVHAGMSMESLRTAARTANECGFEVVAVTVLSDISDRECEQIYGQGAAHTVLKHTTRAMKAGLHGIVCSPLETFSVRKFWQQALILNVAVRSDASETHDQNRTGTHAAAIQAGADLLVCGRQLLLGKNEPDQLAELAYLNNEVDFAAHSCSY